MENNKDLFELQFERLSSKEKNQFLRDFIENLNKTQENINAVSFDLFKKLNNDSHKTLAEYDKADSAFTSIKMDEGAIRSAKIKHLSSLFYFKLEDTEVIPKETEKGIISFVNEFEKNQFNIKSIDIIRSIKDTIYKSNDNISFSPKKIFNEEFEKKVKNLNYNQNKL